MVISHVFGEDGLPVKQAKEVTIAVEGRRIGHENRCPPHRQPTSRRLIDAVGQKAKRYKVGHTSNANGYAPRRLSPAGGVGRNDGTLAVMSDLDLRERRDLCDLMTELGPDAPTLCEGWTTRHLAAHLAIRERDLRAGPGIIFGGPFAGFTDKLQAKEMQRPFDEIIGRVRTPPAGPLSIPAVRSAMSFVEYLVHHEDVRRANGGEPRTDRPDLQAEAWKALCRMGGLLVRKAKTGRELNLVATGSTTGDKSFGKGMPVAIWGEPVELLLYLEGRHSVITMGGAPNDVAAVAAGNFGI